MNDFSKVCGKCTSPKNITTNSMKSKHNLDVHKSILTRILKKEGNLVRKKINRKPALSKAHKKQNSFIR